MPMVTACPACQGRMKVPDTARGRRFRCPRCGHEFLLRRSEAPAPADEVRERIVERPASTAKSGKKPADEESDVQLEVVEEADDAEVVVEVVGEANRPPRERPKKRRRKRRRQRVEEEADEGGLPGWVWWVGGSAGVGLTLFALLLIAILPLPVFVRVGAVYLLIMLPVGTVIFFLAMFLSSVLVGAMELGELHIAAFKAFFLVLCANLASLIGFCYVGYFAAFLVWVLGSVALFRLDFWEARILVGINYGLNIILRIVLLMALFKYMEQGGGGGKVGGGLDDGRPGQAAVHQDMWDAGDIEERGGSVEEAPLGIDGTPTVVSISLRGTRVTDAELAHMKDFPKLSKLDLSNTAITDAGLKHLAGCKQLLTLNVRGTRVTDAGLDDLKRALPRLKVVQ